MDRRCRESEGKVKIEGYMSVSDEEAHHCVDEFTHQILSYGLLFSTFYRFPYTAGPPTFTALMRPSLTFMRRFARSLPTIPYTHRTIGPVPRRRPLI